MLPKKVILVELKSRFGSTVVDWNCVVRGFFEALSLFAVEGLRVVGMAVVEEGGVGGGVVGA